MGELESTSPGARPPSFPRADACHPARSGCSGLCSAAPDEKEDPSAISMLHRCRCHPRFRGLGGIQASAQDFRQGDPQGGQDLRSRQQYVWPQAVGNGVIIFVLFSHRLQHGPCEVLVIAIIPATGIRGSRPALAGEHGPARQVPCSPQHEVIKQVTGRSICSPTAATGGFPQARDKQQGLLFRELTKAWQRQLCTRTLILGQSTCAGKSRCVRKRARLLGQLALERAGDYAAAPTHAAHQRLSRPIAVFTRQLREKITSRTQRGGSHRIGHAIEIWQREQLYAHKNAVTLRLGAVTA